MLHATLNLCTGGNLRERDLAKSAHRILEVIKDEKEKYTDEIYVKAYEAAM